MKKLLIATAIILGLSGMATAEVSNQQLMDRIDQLESKIEKLGNKNRSYGSTVKIRSAEEMRVINQKHCDRHLDFYKNWQKRLDAVYSDEYWRKEYEKLSPAEKDMRERGVLHGYDEWKATSISGLKTYIYNQENADRYLKLREKMIQEGKCH